MTITMLITIITLIKSIMIMIISTMIIIMMIILTIARVVKVVTEQLPRPVCLGEPTVENATTDWVAESLYLTGQAVTATCLQDHLTDGDAAGKNVSCTSVGWEAVGGCYLACVAPPPSAGENMVRGERKNSAVGSVIEYVCSPGFLLRQYGVRFIALRFNLTWS